MAEGGSGPPEFKDWEEKQVDAIGKLLRKAELRVRDFEQQERLFKEKQNPVSADIKALEGFATERLRYFVADLYSILEFTTYLCYCHRKNNGEPDTSSKGSNIKFPVNDNLECPEDETDFADEYFKAIFEKEKKTEDKSKEERNQDKSKKRNQDKSKKRKRNQDKSKERNQDDEKIYKKFKTLIVGIQLSHKPDKQPEKDEQVPEPLLSSTSGESPQPHDDQHKPDKQPEKDEQVPEPLLKILRELRNQTVHRDLVHVTATKGFFNINEKEGRYIFSGDKMAGKDWDSFETDVGCWLPVWGREGPEHRNLPKMAKQLKWFVEEIALKLVKMTFNKDDFEFPTFYYIRYIGDTFDDEYSGYDSLRV